MCSKSCSRALWLSFFSVCLRVWPRRDVMVAQTPALSWPFVPSCRLADALEAHTL